MNPWPKHPVIYEINTWVWLHELSVKYHTLITLKLSLRRSGTPLATLVWMPYGSWVCGSEAPQALT